MNDFKYSTLSELSPPFNATKALDSLIQGKTTEAEHLEAHMAQQNLELRPQQTFQLLALPVEIRTEIYKFVFVQQSIWGISTDSSPLQLLSTCKQIYGEAHKLAYTSTWHGLSRTTALAQRYGRLHPSSRKLIHHLCLEVNGARPPQLHLSDLALYAVAMPLLGVRKLHIRTVWSRRLYWSNMKPLEDNWADVSIERQILGCVRVWPTLERICIEAGCEDPVPLISEREDDMARALKREIEREENEAYRLRVTPAAVFDSRWKDWLDGWDVEFVSSKSRNATKFGGIRMKGKEGTEVRGRNVLIVCVYISYSTNEMEKNHAGCQFMAT